MSVLHHIAPFSTSKVEKTAFQIPGLGLTSIGATPKGQPQAAQRNFWLIQILDVFFLDTVVR